MNGETVYWYSVLTINHFYVLLLFSAAIYLRFRHTTLNQSALLLLAASIPGALAWFAIIVATSIANPNLTLRALLPILMYYPASWLLPLIAVHQIVRLTRSPQPAGKLTYAGVAFTAGLYLLTSATGVARN